MSNKFMYGIITGSMLGLAASAYMANNLTPKQKKRLIKKSNKAINRANDMIDIVRDMV